MSFCNKCRKPRTRKTWKSNGAKGKSWMMIEKFMQLSTRCERHSAWKRIQMELWLATIGQHLNSHKGETRVETETSQIQDYRPKIPHQMSACKCQSRLLRSTTSHSLPISLQVERVTLLLALHKVQWMSSWNVCVACRRKSSKSDKSTALKQTKYSKTCLTQTANCPWLDKSKHHLTQCAICLQT